MARTDDDKGGGVSDTFPLSPRGADLTDGGAHPLARAEGRLAGELMAGVVRTWLEAADKRIVLMWPRNFRARIAPLEILDEDGQVVATGDEWLAVGGGFLRSSDRGSLGTEPVFALSGVVSRAGRAK